MMLTNCEMCIYYNEMKIEDVSKIGDIIKLKVNRYG